MSDKEIADVLDQLLRQAQMRFGTAVRSRWFYDGDGCPGCAREIDRMRYKGKDALSLNAFIFRQHGVLIAYLLCGKCGKQVTRTTETIPLHGEIEKSLKQAFIKHLGH